MRKLKKTALREYKIFKRLLEAKKEVGDDITYLSDMTRIAKFDDIMPFMEQYDFVTILKNEDIKDHLEAYITDNQDDVRKKTKDELYKIFIEHQPIWKDPKYKADIIEFFHELQGLVMVVDKDIKGKKYTKKTILNENAIMMFGIIVFILTIVTEVLALAWLFGCVIAFILAFFFDPFIRNASTNVVNRVWISFQYCTVSWFYVLYYIIFVLKYEIRYRKKSN